MCINLKMKLPRSKSGNHRLIGARPRTPRRHHDSWPAKRAATCSQLTSRHSLPCPLDANLALLDVQRTGRCGAAPSRRAGVALSARTADSRRGLRWGTRSCQRSDHVLPRPIAADPRPTFRLHNEAQQQSLQYTVHLPLAVAADHRAPAFLALRSVSSMDVDRGPTAVLAP